MRKACSKMALVPQQGTANSSPGTPLAPRLPPHRTPLPPSSNVSVAPGLTGLGAVALYTPCHAGLRMASRIMPTTSSLQACEAGGGAP